MLILFLPLVLVLACGKAGGEAYAEEFKPGDRAVVSVDLNGDRVGETLVVSSSPPEEEMGLAFDLDLELTDTRGNVLYSSNELGELDWFSVEKSRFEFEGGSVREIAVVRTGCSGTGVHVYAFLFYEPPRVDTVIMTEDGNDGLYDSDSDGVPDAFVSSYRMQNLGYFGYTSPWLPTFTKPSKADGWQPVDITFDVLARDDDYRKEWIEGIAGTRSVLVEEDHVQDVGSEHMKALKMLEDALDAGDMEEARNVYYTVF